MWYVINTLFDGPDYVNASSNFEALAMSKLNTSKYAEVWVAEPITREDFYKHLDWEFNHDYQISLSKNFEYPELYQSAYRAYVWYYNKGCWRSFMETVEEIETSKKKWHDRSTYECYISTLKKIIGI